VLNIVFRSKPAVSASGVVVVAASKEMLSKVRQLAEQLDRVASKVRLSATFVEVRTTESSGLGVSFVADVLGVELAGAAPISHVGGRCFLYTLLQN
jgi:type II secretory pathway component GspD/PulD (secretin)